MAPRFEPGETFVVWNPVSGRAASRRRAARLVARLERLGYTVRATERPGHATELAAASPHPALLVVGGDGTLFEVLQGLTPGTAFGIYPTGTVNLFARALGVPTAPSRFLALLAAGTTREVYLGLANGKRFASCASTGLDAQTVHEVDPRLKRWVQEVAYGVKAFELYWRYRPPGFRVRLDGDPVHGAFLGVLVGRQPYFGGPQRIFPEAELAAPWLEVILLEGEHKRLLWKYVWGMLSGSLPRMRGARRLRGRHLEVTTDTPMAVEVDGDPCGTTPLVVELDPERWTVLAPRSGDA